MYEIDVDGMVSTVSVAALMEAWAESSPQAVADAMALAVDATAIVCAAPRIAIRRLR